MNNIGKRRDRSISEERIAISPVISSACDAFSNISLYIQTDRPLCACVCSCPTLVLRGWFSGAQSDMYLRVCLCAANLCGWCPAILWVLCNWSLSLCLSTADLLLISGIFAGFAVIRAAAFRHQTILRLLSEAAFLAFGQCCATVCG